MKYCECLIKKLATGLHADLIDSYSFDANNSS